MTRTKIAKLRKLAAWAERYGLNDDEITDIGTQLGAHLTIGAVARIWPEHLNDEPIISERGTLHIVFEDDGWRVACVTTDEELAAVKGGVELNLAVGLDT